MRITLEGRESSTASKNINSTPVALREKTLKLTPPAWGVAPNGKLPPGPRLLGERNICSEFIFQGGPDFVLYL
jgi:hypothetical protein